MTCKDCVYYEACVNLMTDPKRIESMSYGNSEKWLCFKDKSKFIELPCKVGNKVWFIKSAFSYVKRPISAMVCGIKTFSNKSTFTFMSLTDENNISRSFINQDIGKTVFLTEEEAEKALEGINHD